MSRIEKILAVVAALILCAIVALPVSEYLNKSEMILVVKLQEQADPFEALPQALPGNTLILSVKQIDRPGNEYLLRVKTQKKRKDLLDWVLNNKHVEAAEVQSESP